MFNQKFSKSFILGIADADLQVVGEKLLSKEKSQESAWNHYSKKNLPESIGNGIERYSRWKEDLEWIKKLGTKHYRTSISMSRLLNEDGTVNKKALEWYKTWFQSLVKNGIKIYLTLYHWELPQSLQEKGGWENEETLVMFNKHVKAVYTHLNQYVEEYFVVNEPWCASILGNFVGIHAPGNKNLKTALKVAHNLLRAIGQTVTTLKKLNPKIQVSTVSIIFPIYAASNSKEDIQAAKIADQYYNQLYLTPLFTGEYPSELSKHLKEYMPKITKEHMKEINIGSQLNAIGINFYNGDYVKYSKSGPSPAIFFNSSI